ncbi:hypothetical protein IFM89_002810 [Coptis chinensis]|uniref:Exocyst complex component Sec3 PIP2-binding N-terminal domain-containing protein n=1 Tax=Coptis chinensis TaxID=261450 RepID=A0A835LQW3_9MAGN|nr:hypothetical protein IFM89_002810 [Coptis chinensis]
MAKSSADDEELRRACQVAVEGTSSSSSSSKIVMCIKVWDKVARVTWLNLESLLFQPAKLYKLKHLSKVEVISNDPSGCTFFLGFDNLRNQSVAPSQWTMHNINDRNRLLLCTLNICKEVLGQLPKVVDIDIVELALWAKAPIARTRYMRVPRARVVWTRTGRVLDTAWRL